MNVFWGMCPSVLPYGQPGMPGWNSGEEQGLDKGIRSHISLHVVTRAKGVGVVPLGGGRGQSLTFKDGLQGD